LTTVNSPEYEDRGLEFNKVFNIHDAAISLT